MVLVEQLARFVQGEEDAGVKSLALLPAALSGGRLDDLVSGKMAVPSVRKGGPCTHY